MEDMFTPEWMKENIAVIGLVMFGIMILGIFVFWIYDSYLRKHHEEVMRRTQTEAT